MIAENIKHGIDGYLERKEKKTTDSVVFNKFNSIIDKFINVVNTVPMDHWGFGFARIIIEMNSEPDLDIRIKEFFDEYLPTVWDIMRKPVDGAMPIPRIAIDNIMMIKEKLPAPEYIPEEICIIPLEELKNKIPGSKIYQIEDSDIVIFEINYKGHCIKIPLLDSIYHKGGVPRLVAKLFFGAKKHLIDTEVPINDFDLMTYDLEDAKRIMDFLGEMDLSGIELFHDLKYAFSSRDVSINLALLTKEGLVYSPNAKKSYETGVMYHIYADHGIYSKNFFILKGHFFIYDRGFERLMKFLVDGKTDSIEIKKENLQIFMKGYPLVLFGRYLNKPDRAEKFQKIYYILEIMGQLDQYRYCFSKYGVKFHNIFGFFDVLHHFYPQFSIKRSSGDYFTAQWLTNKLLTWFKREFKRVYNVNTHNFDWVILDEKQKWVTFDLKDFHCDDNLSKEIEKWIPHFEERCENRKRFSS